MKSQTLARSFRNDCSHGCIRSQEEVAKMLGISKGRVHQLEQSALRKLRHFLSHHDNDTAIDHH